MIGFGLPAETIFAPLVVANDLIRHLYLRKGTLDTILNTERIPISSGDQPQVDMVVLVHALIGCRDYNDKPKDISASIDMVTCPPLMDEVARILGRFISFYPNHVAVITCRSDKTHVKGSLRKVKTFTQLCNLYAQRSFLISRIKWWKKYYTSLRYERIFSKSELKWSGSASIPSRRQRTHEHSRRRGLHSG